MLFWGSIVHASTCILTFFLKVRIFCTTLLTSRAQRSALGSKAVKLDNNTMMPPAIEGGQRIAMVENCHTPMSPK